MHALITGSSRGLGRAVALRLAAEGARIAVHFHAREAAAQETLAAVRAAGADGIAVRADLTERAQTERLLAEVGDAFGHLDVLVHSARPELDRFYAPPFELDAGAWTAAMESQAGALLAAGKAAARLMRPGGRIVAVTYAPSGRTGSWQPWAAMGTAKAAMESLVRYLAVALAPSGITVNAVSPGWTSGSPATVFDGLPEELQTAIRTWHEEGWTPMRRLATPDDVADAISLLCDERARFVTGQVLHVDGGASLMDPLAPLPAQGL